MTHDALILHQHCTVSALGLDASNSYDYRKVLFEDTKVFWRVRSLRKSDESGPSWTFLDLCLFLLAAACRKPTAVALSQICWGTDTQDREIQKRKIINDTTLELTV